MKKLKRNLSHGITFLLGLMTVISCTKDFSEINTDKNSIALIGPAELPFLFSAAQDAVPIGGQTAENLFADQYTQYFANITTYFPTDRLVIRMDWATASFDPIYVNVVPQLQTIFQNTEVTSAENAIASIWWVYAFHRATDYWGPIPYFNAGVPGTSVPYDSQKDIYDDFFKRLDLASSILVDQVNKEPYGSYDIIYGGDVSKWIKFSNTLRLRLAMRISKIDPARAKTEAEAAVAGGVMTESPEDDAFMLRDASDINAISQMSEWNEFRMTASMESALVGYEDPRLSEYFLPAINSDTYEGARNGLSTDQLSSNENKADALSHVGPRWTSPASGGKEGYLMTPLKVISTAEAYFLRAEGALLGWNMGGTAKELYEDGIRNSMVEWGVMDSAVIDNYINSTLTPIAPEDFLQSRPLATVPVKFSLENEEQLQQIAMQKWIALFPDGVEAWSDFRRRHVLPLYPVANSDNLDITDTNSQWIRRLPFLLSERQTNGAAVEKAVELLGGPDLITTPLWWDLN